MTGWYLEVEQTELVLVEFPPLQYLIVGKYYSHFIDENAEAW